MSPIDDGDVKKPMDYVSVIMLAGHWFPIHTKESLQFISKKPEKDLEVAQLAAKKFALDHQLTFDKEPCKLDKPIITVFKSNAIWYPARICDKAVYPLLRWGNMYLGGTQEKAIQLAKAIATAEQTICVPFLGNTLKKDSFLP